MAPRKNQKATTALPKRKVQLPTNLERLPEAPQFNSHEWADYLELLCLVNIDGLLTKADALDRIRPRAEDLYEGGSDLNTEVTSPIVEDTGLNDLSYQNFGQTTDSWNSHVHELYKHVAFRSRVFGDFYPFVVNNSVDVLSVKQPLSLANKFYLSLLLSANLGYVGKEHHQLTNSFEVLSLEVLKQILPGGAETHIFGTSPLLPRRYTGNLWKKINQLAKDLKERVIALESDFAETNVGDGGLDLVGWCPCGDELNSMPSVFGQSACTSDWVRKQATSASEAWRRKMTFAASPHNMVFIPFCLRNADGSWHGGSTIQSILIDRLRFVHFLRNKLDVFDGLPSRAFVDEILDSKEEII